MGGIVFGAVAAILSAAPVPPGLDRPLSVPESELYRFGVTSRQQTREAWEFSKAYCAGLEERIELSVTRSEGERLLAFRVEAEAEANRKAWELLDDAFLFPERRLALCGKLRQLLGDRDYFLGRMPPPAPFHQFRELGK